MPVPQKQPGEGRRKALETLARIPPYTPREIADLIRREGYVGQPQAVRAASLWAFRHLARLRKIHLRNIGRESLPPKTNMLFVGPTGCGKTFLIEILCREILKLPTVIVDVTGFSETGYVGQDVSSILTRLLYAADLDLDLCALGVVCLDEFDKLASGQNTLLFAGAGTGKDVSGLGVQRELLKLLEKAEIPVPLELSHSDYTPRPLVCTQDIVYVACGTFSGLKGLIELGEGGHIGFGRAEAPGRVHRIAAGFSENDVSLVRNFQEYGFLPELIGRFKRIIPFEALDAEQLKTILELNTLVRYRNEFSLDGIELEVEGRVLDRIIGASLKRETGARGIDAAFIQCLEEAAFDAYSRPGVRRVRISLTEGEIRFEIT
jgi:ATP-dependent Clp protease ATP-binding subunit ClpX